uniref:GNAT family N-acetyltransferase n=1 Tax=Stappia sp. TaxID=1870903 RepID=UPI003BAB28B8
MANVERMVEETPAGQSPVRPDLTLVPGVGGAAGLSLVVFAPHEAEPHLPAWTRLADAALEPNPFFRPEFLLPYLEGVDHGGRVHVVAVRDGAGACLALLPVRRARAGLFMSAACGLAGAYGPLGTPLVDGRLGRDAAVAALALLLDGAAGACGTRLVALPFLRTDGSVADMLRAAVQQGNGAFRVAGRSVRAGHATGREGEAQFAGVRAHRRKELRRLGRRLAEQGPLTVTRIGAGKVDAAAIDAFLDLEASGWKGRAGTALAVEPARAGFARDFLLSLAARGRLVIDRIALGDKPVAMLVQIRDGARLHAWKIARDEAFDAYSPGAQVARAAMRATLDGAEETGITGADSLAIPGHAMIAPLWRGEVSCGTGLCSTARGARWRVWLGAHDIALEGRARALARRLRDALRRRRGAR